MPRRKTKTTEKDEKKNGTAIVKVPKRIFLFTISTRVVFPNRLETLVFRAGDDYSIERIKRDGLIALESRFDGEEEHPLVATILGVTEIDEENQTFLARPTCKTIISDVKRSLDGEDAYDCVCSEVYDQRVTEAAWSGTVGKHFLELKYDFLELFNTFYTYNRIFKENAPEEEMMQDPVLQEKALDISDLFARLRDLSERLPVTNEETAYETINILGNFFSQLAVFLWKDSILTEQALAEHHKSLREVLLGNDPAFAFDHFRKMAALLDERMWQNCRRGNKSAVGEKPLPEGMPQEIKDEVERLLPHAKRESSDGHSLSQWIEFATSLPYGKGSAPKVDLRHAAEVLEEDHTGLKKIKTGIVDFIAAPGRRAPILCFVGPPGVGKTSLGKSIARSLGRKFVRISLGGVRDEAVIRGHRRTYIGAIPGEILMAFKKAGTTDPVIMIDEGDKMVKDSVNGDPEAALLEALDPEQNFGFNDHYLGFPYDCSRAIFIITANVLHKMSQPFRDRAQIFQLRGYAVEEKVDISRKHLIDKVAADLEINYATLKKEGLPIIKFTFSDDGLRLIASEYVYDTGMRGQEKKMESVARKGKREIMEGKLKRLEAGTDIKVDDENGEKVDAKLITFEPQDIRELLGKPEWVEQKIDLDNLPPGVAPILTVDGETGQGAVGFVEVSLRKANKFDRKATGHLREVIAESFEVARDHLTHEGGVLEGVTHKLFVHAHAVPASDEKDGPSAGVQTAGATYSAVINVPMKRRFAGTGEIALKIKETLVVGGIPEKLLAAKMRGITEVAIPAANRDDVIDLPISGLRVVAPEEVEKSGKEWREFSLEEKPEGSFTVYLAPTVDAHLQVAFPNDYPPSKELLESVKTRLKNGDDNGNGVHKLLEEFLDLLKSSMDDEE